MSSGRLAKYGKMLLAILAGNGIYFGLSRYLPEHLKHDPFHFDAGLLFDFLLCLLIWLLIREI